MSDSRYLPKSVPMRLPVAPTIVTIRARAIPVYASADDEIREICERAAADPESLKTSLSAFRVVELCTDLSRDEIFGTEDTRGLSLPEATEIVKAAHALLLRAPLPPSGGIH